MGKNFSIVLQNAAEYISKSSRISKADTPERIGRPSNNLNEKINLSISLMEEGKLEEAIQKTEEFLREYSHKGNDSEMS